MIRIWRKPCEDIPAIGRAAEGEGREGIMLGSAESGGKLLQDQGEGKGGQEGAGRHACLDTVFKLWSRARQGRIRDQTIGQETSKASIESQK